MLGVVWDWGEPAVMCRSIVDDLKPPTAEYYRGKAEEIRHAATLAISAQVAAELLETAKRFDVMASYVERWALNAAGRQILTKPT